MSSYIFYILLWCSVHYASSSGNYYGINYDVHGVGYDTEMYSLSQLQAIFGAVGLKTQELSRDLEYNFASDQNSAILGPYSAHYKEMQIIQSDNFTEEDGKYVHQLATVLFTDVASNDAIPPVWNDELRFLSQVIRKRLCTAVFGASVALYGRRCYTQSRYRPFLWGMMGWAGLLVMYTSIGLWYGAWSRATSIENKIGDIQRFGSALCKTSVVLGSDFARAHLPQYDPDKELHVYLLKWQTYKQQVLLAQELRSLSTLLTSNNHVHRLLNNSQNPWIVICPPSSLQAFIFYREKCNTILRSDHCRPFTASTIRDYMTHSTNVIMQGVTYISLGTPLHVYT